MNSVREAFASLTAGQRWTASLAVALGVVVLVFGLPEQTRPLAPVPVTAARPDRAAALVAPTSPAADDPLPRLDLAVSPLVRDLAPSAAEPTTTTTTAPPPPSGPPPPPSTVCTPPLGITLSGIEQLDAVLCAVIASVPVV
jgi:hypothetical protein